MIPLPASMSQLRVLSSTELGSPPVNTYELRCSYLPDPANNRIAFQELSTGKSGYLNCDQMIAWQRYPQPFQIQDEALIWITLLAAKQLELI